MKALNNDLLGFVEQHHPVRFEGKFDPKANTYVVRARVDAQPDWVEAGLQLGDAIHNARSALDHAVWQLVLLNGEKPGRSNAFPVAMSGGGYWCSPSGSKSLRDNLLRGVAEEHRAIIDDAQPYRGRHSPKDHALSALAHLSNVDKHQVIHVGFLSIGAADGYHFGGEVSGNVDEQVELEVHSGPFQEDTDIVTMRFAVTGPGAHMDMEIEVPVDIAFSERGYTINQLFEVLDFVEFVLKDIGTVF